MSKEQTLTLMFAERDKLNRAIEVLRRRGRPPGPRSIAPAKRKRRLSEAGRKAISEVAKKHWADQGGENLAEPADCQQLLEPGTALWDVAVLGSETPKQYTRSAWLGGVVVGKS